jgi:hypothetical protein
MRPLGVEMAAVWGRDDTLVAVVVQLETKISGRPSTRLSTLWSYPRSSAFIGG